jgi:hypothetical protein
MFEDTLKKNYAILFPQNIEENRHLFLAFLLELI